MGIVFDIQRGSIHDGPGIRTTVFLKGCPLRCIWCHNPEAAQPGPQLCFQERRCADCGRCVPACTRGAHFFLNRRHAIHFDRCEACGACVLGCDYSALRIVGSELPAENVMKEVRADIDFYRASGGGITLSGGEPLLQPEFARELLLLCKEAGIHTCVETSGFAAAPIFERTIPYIDLLLFDYKLTDAALHRQYTGVSYELILQNLDTAYRAGVPIVLRCPLIPGINDNDAHLRGIADLNARYPRLQGVEIMPYHNLGISKSQAIGAEQMFHARMPDEAERESWRTRLIELGCASVTFG